MSRPDMETRRVRALSARTHHVIGFGMVHFDHENVDEEKRYPIMPVAAIPALVAWGWIADDEEGYVGDPLDLDGDGEPGGSVPHEPPALTGKTKAELLGIAADEGVSVEDGAKNADIIAAIELAREEKAAAAANAATGADESAP